MNWAGRLNIASATVAALLRAIAPEKPIRRKSMKKLDGIMLGKMAALLAFALLACTTVIAQDVRYNFMPGTDFSKFHTYKWVNIKDGSHPNQIVDAEIKQAVDSQLAAKGQSTNNRRSRCLHEIK
jgi:hypothetical protein